MTVIFFKWQRFGLLLLQLKILQKHTLFQAGQTECFTILTRLAWKPYPKGRHLSVCSFETNTHPPPPWGFFRRTSVSQWFLCSKISCRVSTPSERSLQKFFITWQTKKIKFLLKNKVKNPRPAPSKLCTKVRATALWNWDGRTSRQL